VKWLNSNERRTQVYHSKITFYENDLEASIYEVNVSIAGRVASVLGAAPL
jgi:hypothetical protein